MILNENNQTHVRTLLSDTIDMAINFKLQKDVINTPLSLNKAKQLLEKIPENGTPESDVLKEFRQAYLPYCFNESSKNSVGFPDCGNDSAAMMGSLLSNLLQQNLINQSQSSPSVTFAEINVIQWLREIIGYDNKEQIDSIDDCGGIITSGGTASNTIAMMLARENHVKNTLYDGVRNPDNFKVIVPDSISHYSIKSSLMWIGCGASVIKVKTKNFRMDLDDLKSKLIEHGNDIMSVVVFCGDSRTMTIDNLIEIHNIVRSYNPNIWLHADACHGFSLGFSDTLKSKISGIQMYDSISTDPHKVLMIPYTLSALLVKNPHDFKMIKTESDLIMNEPYAFGQITPFIGSKDASSLKLWFLLKHHGRQGIGDLIEKRHEIAKCFEDKLIQDENFIVLNKVDINSIMFLIKPREDCDLKTLNNFNEEVYNKIKDEGKYFFHNFPIKISDGLGAENVYTPLRFMSGNPNLKVEDLDEIIAYLKTFIVPKKEVSVHANS